MCRPQTSGSTATLVMRKIICMINMRKRKKLKHSYLKSSWDFDACNGKFHTDYNVYNVNQHSTGSRSLFRGA